jgi:hypothetical protein
MTLEPRAFFVCALAAIAAAQATTNATQPDVHTVGGVTIQGSIRSRLEMWDWFEPDRGTNNYAFLGSILRLSLSKSVEQWDWQVEFALPFLLDLPDQAVAPGVQGQLGLGATYFVANQQSQNSAMLFPKQAFFRWKNLGGVEGQSVRIGRFELGDGSERAPQNATLAALKRDRINQRLIGTFGFSHVGRSFDGVQYSFNKTAYNFTLVGAVPTRGAFQTDGWGETHIGFTYAAFTRGWGRGGHVAETRLLGIYYQDWRHIVKTDSRPLAIRSADLANVRIGTMGGHHISAVATRAGTLDLLLWGVAQTGRWGSLDHRAHAIAVEAGFQPALRGAWAKRWQPWIRMGVFNGSGDGNANDKLHETFFQILPTPRVFARFPCFNLMNNRDLHAALISRPHNRVTISNEFHSLRLFNRQDLWYLGGGAFQPWTFGYTGRAAGGAQSLANLFDIQADVRFPHSASLTGYFGYAQGLAAMRTVYPRGQSGRFGYLEMTYRF